MNPPPKKGMLKNYEKTPINPNTKDQTLKTKRKEKLTQNPRPSLTLVYQPFRRDSGTDKGPGFFNAESYEFQDADAAKKKFLEDQKRMAEIERKRMETLEMLMPMNRSQMNRYTPPGGFIGAPTR